MLGFLKGLFPPPPDERIETARLTLRPSRLSDWAQWANVREQSRAFLTPYEPAWPRDALSRAAYRERVFYYAQEWHRGTGYLFFAIRREDRRLMGGISIAEVRRGIAQTATVGYWIGEPYARQGYMTEALEGIVRFAFGPLSLHRLEAACMPANTASRRLLTKCGFCEEGYAAQYLKINGVWADHVLYARLNAARQACPAAPEERSRTSTPILASARSHFVSKS
ncbi:MAG TPA: GNAT family protein [Alphaproteobacteria bacterium]|nr:GNAT family protein [Alphaproteobacteria bacterium]